MGHLNRDIRCYFVCYGHLHCSSVPIKKRFDLQLHVCGSVVRTYFIYAVYYNQ